MCGRFVQHSKPELYASAFGAVAPFESHPRYNVAPTQTVLAVRAEESGVRALVSLRWGFVPGWSKGPDNRYSMINARAETVDTKPAYRNAFKRQRCIIPSEGFFEWKASGGKKTPYLIRHKDNAPFGMAGLWDVWHDKDGATLESCTILVTDANAIVREIHDRMPVVLSHTDYSAWLDPETKDIDYLKALLRPAPPAPWILAEVSRRVNSPMNDSPELLEPVAVE